jgi:perosamine synthetase
MSRWQLPVYSPIGVPGILAGLRAAAAGDAAPRAAVTERLRQTFAARDLVLTDSGTSALTAALRAIGSAGPRLRVALPAYTCYDVATAADGADAEVVLYDVDPRTLKPDLVSLRDAVGQGVSAVVVAHLYGMPVHVAQVREICDAAGVRVIEDGAQAAGAELAGRRVGSGAPLLVLSFGRGKGVTAGSGGALLGGDAEGVALVEAVRAALPAPVAGVGEVVRLAAQWLLGRPGVYALPVSLPFLHLGETWYRAPSAVRGMSRAATATLSYGLGAADREGAARRRNARRLLGALGQNRALTPIAEPEGARPGYLRLPLVASAGARRLAESPVSRRLGIMPGYPLPLARLPGWAARCVNAGAGFPGASELADRLVTLPTHSRLGAADLGALERWMSLAAGA